MLRWHSAQCLWKRFHEDSELQTNIAFDLKSSYTNQLNPIIDLKNR